MKIRELWRRLNWLVRRGAFEQELDEEMRHHLALIEEEQGNSEKAKRQFGNVTFWRESSRMAWSIWIWEDLAQDLRYSLRAMCANKLFTLMAVLSLALGIGANTAIYSFMDAIMLRALPVKQPDQLVLLNWRAPANPGVVNSHSGTSYRDANGREVSPNVPYHAYEFLRANNHSFSQLFGFANAGRLNMLVNGQAFLGQGEYVSGGYFAGLGVGPAIGRLIGAADDQLSAQPIVALSYAFWRGRFGGSRTVLGKSILINGKPFVVVGVTASEFFGIRPPRVPDVFIPVRDLPAVSLDRYRNVQSFFSDDHTYWIEMMARLKSGVSFAGAQSEVASLFLHWVTQTARNDQDRATLPKLWLESGGSGIDSLRRQYSKPLLVLMSMVSLILAIACANIANLLLSRAATRRREIAVRLSLGAGRLRVMRQLLTESIVLALAGGLLGIFVAAAGIRFLTLLMGNGQEDFTLNAHLDWRVLLFSLAVALATGLLFGLAPAIQATSIHLTPALKEARASDPLRRFRRLRMPFGLRQILVVSQIAISTLLVAGAGLFVGTLKNLNSVALGFNQEHILLFSLNGAQAGYKDQPLADLYADLQRRFASIPGVRGATLTDMRMVSNWVSSTSVTIPGSSKEDGTSITAVGPDFFSTMQIPILAGRPIDDHDRMGSKPVAVVNQVFARKYFPGMSPIGRHFRLGGKERGRDLEIVGLARSARYSSLKDEIPPVTYSPYSQSAADGQLQQMFFELRTAGDPLALANSVRSIVHSVCPRVPVADLRTQSQAINETISQERTFAALCTCFGILALVIACVGLYATTAYAVTRRTNEIGIRMALGALRRRIVWMVVSEVTLLGLVGVAFGLSGIWEVTAFLKSFLWGLQPHDSATLGGAALILLSCTLAAGLYPAWRAARIDPMMALRHE